MFFKRRAFFFQSPGTTCFNCFQKRSTAVWKSASGIFKNSNSGRSEGRKEAFSNRVAKFLHTVRNSLFNKQETFINN